MIRNCLVVLMRGHFRSGGDPMLKMMGGSRKNTTTPPATRTAALSLTRP
jgi:hypothetical protein